MRIIYTLLFLLLTHFSYSQMQFSWAKSFNGNGTQLLPKKIVTDNAGNSYVAGCFSGTQTFDTVSIVAKGTTDAYLAKFNATGNCLWARTYGFSISQTYGTCVAIDAAGNVILGGNFTNYFNIDTSYTISLGQTDMFMIKHDTQGNLIKFNTAGGTSTDNLNTITTDMQGRYYIGGSFGFKCFFGNDSIQTPNLSPLSDIFLAAYDVNMQPVWAKRAGGASDNDVAKSIQFRNNSIYLAGIIIGNNCTFGTNSVNSYGQSDAVVAKYALDGTNQWVKRAGGTANDYCNALSTDSFGNVYITGAFILNATFGAAPSSFNLTAGNAEDMFIAKYDSLGVCKFAKKAGSAAPGSDAGNGISTDSYGYSVVAGSFMGTANFVSTTLTSSGVGDGFVAKYDPTGTCQYALKIGGSGDDLGMNVCWSPANNYFYAVGGYQGTATLTGNITLTASNTFSGFIAGVPGFYASINEVNQINNLVYPNPANNVLSFNTSYLNQAHQVEVYDVVGNMVYVSNDITDNLTINTTAWANGFYTVKLLSAENVSMMKVLIAH